MNFNRLSWNFLKKLLFVDHRDIRQSCNRMCSWQLLSPTNCQTCSVMEVIEFVVSAFISDCIIPISGTNISKSYHNCGLKYVPQENISVYQMREQH
jgi:hypothetical protein